MTDTTELRRRLREALERCDAGTAAFISGDHLRIKLAARDLLTALDAEDAARQIRFAADHFSTETPDFDA